MDVSKLINHISGLKKKTHANISTEKILDKMQHPLAVPGGSDYDTVCLKIWFDGKILSMY